MLSARFFKEMISDEHHRSRQDQDRNDDVYDNLQSLFDGHGHSKLLVTFMSTLPPRMEILILSARFFRMDFS